MSAEARGYRVVRGVQLKSFEDLRLRCDIDPAQEFKLLDQGVAQIGCEGRELSRSAQLAQGAGAIGEVGEDLGAGAQDCVHFGLDLCGRVRKG